VPRSAHQRWNLLQVLQIVILFLQFARHTKNRNVS
jgi:hypothetical protein